MSPFYEIRISGPARPSLTLSPNRAMNCVATENKGNERDFCVLPRVACFAGASLHEGSGAVDIAVWACAAMGEKRSGQSRERCGREQRPAADQLAEGVEARKDKGFRVSSQTAPLVIEALKLCALHACGEPAKYSSYPHEPDGGYEATAGP